MKCVLFHSRNERTLSINYGVEIMMSNCLTAMHSCVPMFTKGVVMRIFHIVLAVFLFIPAAASAATTLTVTSGGDNDAGSLQQIVSSANAGDRIVFSGAVNTVSLGSGATLNVPAANLTLAGNGTLTLKLPNMRALLSGLSGLGSGSSSAWDVTKKWYANNFPSQLDAALLAAKGYASTLTTIDGGGAGRTNSVLLNVNDAGANLNLGQLHFTNANISAPANLYGGGVIGASNELGSVSIGTVSGSLFEGNVITSINDTLKGGGVLGAYASFEDPINMLHGNATVGAVSDSLFVGNKINRIDYFQGGGVVGAWSEFGNATVGVVSNSLFVDNMIAANEILQGGGVIGAYSVYSDATIGEVSGSLFAGNEIDVTEEPQGGGVVGARSTYGRATLGAVSDSLFADNVITAGTSLLGGGVVGAWSYFGPSAATMVSAVSGSLFAGNEIRIAKNLEGGGVVGAWSDDKANATIGAVSGSLFTDNVITTGEGLYSVSLQGGGVVGARSAAGAVSIGAVSNSIFINNTVSATHNIMGAAGIGAYINDTAATISASLGDITSSHFENLTATTTNGDVYAGAIYSSGLSDELTITNSSFINNTATASGAAYGGAIAIDTAYGLGVHTHTVTLANAAGENTVFSGNAATSGAVSRNNSLFFGNIRNTSLANAALNITPTGGSVVLLDPVNVEMDSGNFTMSIGGNGNITLGGSTMLNAAGGSIVTFDAGPEVLLTGDYQLDNASPVSSAVAGNLFISFNTGNQLYLDLANRPKGDALALIAETGTGAVSVADTANFSPLLTTFAPLDDKWLLADSADVTSVNSANFTASSSSLFNLKVIMDGGKIYLKADNAPVAPILNSITSVNPRAAFDANAFQDVWDTRLKNLILAGVGPSGINARFEEILFSPQHYLAELALNMPHVALRFQNDLIRKTLLSHRKTFRNDTVVSQNYSQSAYASVAPGYDAASRTTLWAGYMGGISDQNAESGFFGYDSHYNGVYVGGSYAVSNAIDLGGYFGYAAGKTDSDSLNSQIDSDMTAVGLMATFRPASRFAVTLDGGFAYFNNDMQRHNLYDGQLSSNFEQRLWSLGAEAIYSYELGVCTSLDPFVSFRWQNLHQDAFTESGGMGFANSLGKVRADSVASRLGATLSHQFFVNGHAVKPALSLAWRHEFGDDHLSTSNSFVASPIHFEMEAKSPRDFAEAGVSLQAELYRNHRTAVSLEAAYDLQAADQYLAHNFYAGVRFDF